MSQSSTASPPSTRSRRPRSHTEQSRSDSATAWLNNNNRTPSTCPVQAVTKLISADVSIGTMTLSKSDPAKLTGLYALMHKIERLHLVEDLRLDVSARSQKEGMWRGVMEMAEEQSMGDRGLTAFWGCLGAVCQHSLDVTRQLKDRLQWCEREFEAGKLPADADGEERVWNEGLEIQMRESASELSVE